MSSRIGTYKHRPTQPRGWLWGLAAMFIGIGIFVFKQLEVAAETNVQMHQLRWLVLVICITLACICAIIATSSRWFYS